MANQGPVPAIKDHKKVGDDIDDAYVACLAAAADLHTYLVKPRGNRMEVFVAFYEPFVGLFMHTRNLTEMAKSDDVTVRDLIASWIEFKGVPTLKRMRYGLYLFKRYQKELLMKGVVVPSRQ